VVKSATHSPLGPQQPPSGKSTTRVSVTSSGGGGGNAFGADPAINSDGTVVAFTLSRDMRQVRAAWLVPGVIVAYAQRTARPSRRTR